MNEKTFAPSLCHEKIYITRKTRREEKKNVKLVKTFFEFYIKLFTK